MQWSYMFGAIVVLLFSFYAPAMWASRDLGSVHQSAAVGPIEECIGCHAMAAPDHPLDQAASLQNTLPLGAGGRMTCTTCHDCTQHTCPIRLQKEKMCQVCHDCSTGMACLIATAHMGNSSDLHLHIKDCQACHDGTLAKNAGGPEGHLDAFYLAGKDYKGAIDRRIILIDGRVTCISCHDPYSSEPKRLVMSNHRSRLCLECHRK